MYSAIAEVFREYPRLAGAEIAARVGKSKEYTLKLRPSRPWRFRKRPFI
ncbi:MAG TPA: hypothetical protein VGR56_05125 [Nitrososphaerales archaeon]|nr:hypothetical protein [Nitrososphaerales archaeon]